MEEIKSMTVIELSNFVKALEEEFGVSAAAPVAAGAVAGGVAGQGVQSAMNKTQGVELEIRKDDGNTIMVVQKQGNTRFSPGQRVVLASNGSQVTVSPR